MKIYQRFFLAASLLFITVKAASAQLINTAGMSEFTGEIQTKAGFTDFNLGFIIASILSTFMGLLTATFIVLMSLAGFRWMNAGGNEDAVKKAQETIKNSLIGLILVLAAWAITYFIFKALPFSGPSGVTNQITAS